VKEIPLSRGLVAKVDKVRAMEYPWLTRKEIETPAKYGVIQGAK
jgi:hypothetical protein